MLGSELKGCGRATTWGPDIEKKLMNQAREWTDAVVRSAKERGSSLNDDEPRRVTSASRHSGSDESVLEADDDVR